MATPLRRYHLQGSPLVWQIPGEVAPTTDPVPTVPETPTTPGVYTLLNSNWDTAAVANPIVPADMWAAMGQKLGDAGTFQRTSVVAATGHGNVVSQSVLAGEYGTGFTTGKAGISMFPKLARAVEDATLSYDFRINGDFGWGGKLPGLGGKLPSAGGSPPTGGTPSPYGWSGRMMWLTPDTYGGKPASPAEIIGYLYAPTQVAPNYGLNRYTGKAIALATWFNVKVRTKMNSINVEGSSGNPDGIHQIWVNDVLVYEKTTEVFRIYQQANNTHLAWSIFYGGADNQWAPTVNSSIQIDNLVITTPEAA